MNISYEDLVIAYRKAKADAFYETGHLTAKLFAQYEVDLFENLEAFMKLISSSKRRFLLNKNFVGDHTFILKCVDPVEAASPDDKDGFVFFSDGKRQWELVSEIEPDFRIIGQHSVNFHILSSLWIDKVGYRLEALVSDNSYGCRLKRPNQRDGRLVPQNGDENSDKFQLGHFRAYFGDYKRWQQNGINAIKKAISEGKKVLAVTTDLKKFYHRVDPSFLLEPDFLSELGVELSEDDVRITKLLIAAIKAWSDVTLDDSNVSTRFEKNGHCGIPIGLGASKVIANLLLFYLDKEIESEVLPIYYGRYVDDIFLVLEDKGKILSRNEFWKFLSKRMEHLNLNENVQGSNSEMPGPTFSIPFAQLSSIEFGIGKEKLFLLDGASGSSFIHALQESLDENSSEWKMLPVSEDDLGSLGKDIAAVSSDFEEPANGLRKSDGVSIQRLRFAIRLRNFEALVEILPKPFWLAGIRHFFDMLNGFILTPERVATYSKYYPRMLRLAIRADDPVLASSVFNAVDNAWSLLYSKVKKGKRPTKLAWNYSKKLLQEAIYSAIDFSSDKYKKSDWKAFFEIVGIDLEEVYRTSELLFFADLHANPLRSVFLDRKIPASWGNSKFELHELDVNNLLDGSVFDLPGRRDFIRSVLLTPDNANRVANFVPKGMFFYTRPFSALEITELYQEWASTSGMEKIKSFLSLFNIPMFAGDIQETAGRSDEPPIDNIVKLSLNDGNEEKDRTFALTSFLTEESSWTAWVMGTGNEPDFTRYTRLFRLVNEVMRCRKDIHYLLFPELSVPRKVLMYLAFKLKSKGISLIVGAEYEKRSVPAGFPPNIKSIVSNQLVYILTTHINGIVEQVYIAQEKTIAAIHEERELYMTGGSVLSPTNNTKYLINHGGFIFSGLICNDLLNIDNRQRLRGWVDALIIVEWNKDVDMYDSLIQSCSSDLHCFVLQINNRKYGDTRLRGPYKESYDRDKVRIRGGELDYFVVASLEVEKLREFQRYHRSPGGPFKPVPTGFIMSAVRRKGV